MEWGLLFVIQYLVPAVYSSNDQLNTTVDGIQVVNLKWESIETPYMISLWLLIAALAKIIFNTMKPISNVFPDSSLLIVIGLVLGALLRQSGAGIDFSLDSHAFFLYLLPPIIFDAGYFMPNRALFENLDSVLLFSVVGTIWNTMAIGGSLLLLSNFNLFTMQFSVFEIFVFSALISAVDPVAVIAVFEEINVNEFLFVNVFGEALFNDGVTVVLYHMFKSFTLIGAENLRPVDYGLGCLSFFVVTIGGLAIGLLFAFSTALVTKYTGSVKILAPVFIFVLPYMAYLTAEMTSLSSIIAIAVCGMAMKLYVKENISTAAAHSVKYFTKMLAQSSETVIFMFLGLSTISSHHYWDTWFVLSTIVFCLVWRTVGVLIQCWILNKFRHKKFTKVDQFVLSYGGLRGAIAFGLAVSMPASIAARDMFVTTTITIIFFTVFLQGITIRPLVQYLNVETKDHRPPTMTESVYNKYLDYIMSGLEDIAGQQGAYSFRDNFERFNAKVLRPVLLRNEQKRDFDASTIVRAYAKITLEDALNLTREHKRPKNKKMSQLKVPEISFGQKIEYDNVGYEKETLGDNQKTVTPKERQLQRYLQSGQNIENLYSLFSDLLDRKLREINATREIGDDEEDDIHDDYMKQMHSNTGSNVNLRAHTEELAPIPFSRNLRRQSTGTISKKTTFVV